MQQPAKHNRSIFLTILIPMIVVLLLEIAIFGSILYASGALNRLEQNDRDILSQQVASRRDSIEHYLVSLSSDVTSLGDAITKSAEELAAESHLDVRAIGADPSATAKLETAIVENMVSTLRGVQSSGVFVIFNTSDLSAMHGVGAYGTMPGVYIRDLDPSATPSTRNEDLILNVGSSEIVQSFRITTDVAWKPQFNLDGFAGTDEYEFIYRTFQTPYAVDGPKKASDYAYWGESSTIGSLDGSHNVVFALPLILQDGTVFGVVGVDLSSEYLATLLPCQELLGGQDSSYVLAMVPEQDAGTVASGSIEMTPVVLSGAKDEMGLIQDVGSLFTAKSPEDYTYTVDQSYFAVGKQLRLYNSNSPTQDCEWMLLGMAPEALLHQFTNHVRSMIALAAVLMGIVGIAGSIIAGRSISSPVKRLSDEVAHAQLSDSDTMQIPELSRTGIEEIDQLTGAITSLSNDIASVRFLEQQRMEYERDYDMLTGLMNRRAFYREANKIFESPAKLKNAAIVMLDIDNLKDINDMYGHDWGDKYVHAAARSFEAAVPPTVLVSRVSGDEFYLLFYGYESKEEIEERVEYMRQSIPATEFVFPDGKQGHINVSGGVALYLKDGDEFAELMRLADFTMYQAKAAGKNNIAYFDLDVYQRTTKALKATDELEDILRNYQLVTYHFQPIFDARTGKPYAYEALMRVSLDVLQSPSDVLTYARQEKRLVDIERLTWTRTLQCYRSLLENGQIDPEPYLFINTFANLSLGEAELAALASENADLMSRVVIEVTEAETMDDKATEIKRNIPGTTGFFALDDYGSGYNSEVMLLELKPKFVKVDISIIRGIDSSIDKQRIVSQVLEYAHERDMLIIAEGVETADELDTVLELGVDLIQGFYLSRPAAVPSAMSADGLQHLLDAINS